LIFLASLTDWSTVVTNPVKLWSWKIFGTSAAGPCQFTGSEAQTQKADEDLLTWRGLH